MRKYLMIFMLVPLLSFGSEVVESIYKGLGAAKAKDRRAALVKAQKLSKEDKIKLIKKLKESKDPELKSAAAKIKIPLGKVTKEMLLGKWSLVSGSWFDLKKDGSFVGYGSSGEQFITGKWMLEKNALIWIYDKDTEVAAKGEKDTNPILKFSPKEMTIKEMDGRTTVLTRKK